MDNFSEPQVNYINTVNDSLWIDLALGIFIAYGIYFCIDSYLLKGKGRTVTLSFGINIEFKKRTLVIAFLAIVAIVVCGLFAFRDASARLHGSKDIFVQNQKASVDPRIYAAAFIRLTPNVQLESVAALPGTL